MDLTEKVAAALKDSILPSVIARGGDIRVLAVDDGVVTLELSGSPGASIPLLARMEARLRVAVSEISQVRAVGLDAKSSSKTQRGVFVNLPAYWRELRAVPKPWPCRELLVFLSLFHWDNLCDLSRGVTDTWASSSLKVTRSARYRTPSALLAGGNVQ